MSTLQLGRDVGGQRFFLDGLAVHCGTVLDLLYEHCGTHVWLEVRLEFSLSADPVVIVCLDGMGSRHELRVSPGPRLESMRFRWPPRCEDCGKRTEGGLCDPCAWDRDMRS